MKWISIKDALPVIPEGDYGVNVIAAEFDSTYEEVNPGHGYSVHQVFFGYTHPKCRAISRYYEGVDLETDFMDLYIGADTVWGPCADEVTHWMYLPDPPKMEDR